MQQYIGTKLVTSTPMNRADYNTYRGWTLPENEDGSDDGYLVEYQDGGKPNDSRHAGYISWSPKAQHDAAYRPCDAMTFGLAVEALKKGMRVSRAGWNGKGMWLEYVPTNGVDLAYIRMSYPVTGLQSGPYHNGARVPWLASQTDVLAEDWQIVS